MAVNVAESSLHFVGQSSLAKPDAHAQIDVVFIHGLGGDPFTTWQDGDATKFWPKWLAEDLGAAINVFTAGFNSGVFASALAGDGPSIIDHSTALLDFLLAKGVGQRKLVLITHSLGGLIAKQMLRRCSDAANNSRKRLLEAVSGIVFIGTPHLGAGGATILKTLLRVFASKNVDQLKFGEEQLLDLGEWFRNWASENRLPVSAYYEVRPLPPVGVIVGKASANPYVTGCEPTSIDDDHIGIAKPTSRQSQLYLSVLQLIREQIAEPGEGGVGGVGGGASPADDGSPCPNVCPIIMAEFEYFKTASPSDRRTLAQKLEDAKRKPEVGDAERKKDRFTRALESFGENPSAIARFAHILTDAESLFNRHARTAIAKGETTEAVNDIVQEKVINAAVTAHRVTGVNSTPSLIDNALYYLTGNCHIRWDHD